MMQSSKFTNIAISISFRLELIPLREGVSRVDPSSPLVSITSIFLLQSVTLQVLLYHVSSSLLLDSNFILFS